MWWSDATCQLKEVNLDFEKSQKAMQAPQKYITHQVIFKKNKYE